MLVWRSVQNNSLCFSVAQIYTVGGCSWTLWMPRRSICFSSSLTPLTARQYFPTFWKERRHPLMPNDFGNFQRCRNCLISLMHYVGTSFQRHSEFLWNECTKTWRELTCYKRILFKLPMKKMCFHLTALEVTALPKVILTIATCHLCMSTYMYLLFRLKFTLQLFLTNSIKDYIYSTGKVLFIYQIWTSHI